MDDSSIQLSFRQRKANATYSNPLFHAVASSMASIAGSAERLSFYRVAKAKESSSFADEAIIVSDNDCLKKNGGETSIFHGEESSAQIYQFPIPTISAENPVKISWSSSQKIGLEPIQTSPIEDRPSLVSFHPDRRIAISSPTLVPEWSVVPIARKKQNSISDTIESLASLTIVLGASWLLIRSSAEVFGFTPDGWLKALLLELGILGLSLYKSEDELLRYGSKLGAAALIALSVMALHTGVKKSEAKELSAVAIKSETLSFLREDRSRILAAHDALPETHITKRNALMEKVQALSSRIEEEKEKAGETAQAKVIEDSHMVESLMRLALMFLNIIFSHRLAALLKRSQAPDLRLADFAN